MEDKKLHNFEKWASERLGSFILTIAHHWLISVLVFSEVLFSLLSYVDCCPKTAMTYHHKSFLSTVGWVRKAMNWNLNICMNGPMLLCICKYDDIYCGGCFRPWGKHRNKWALCRKFSICHCSLIKVMLRRLNLQYIYMRFPSLMSIIHVTVECGSLWRTRTKSHLF